MNNKTYTQKTHSYTIRYLSLLCLILSLNACSDNDEAGTTDSTGTISDTGFTSISLQSSVSKVQPMTGIVFWTDNESALADLGDTVQLEYSYMIYSDIVSQENVYDWTVVDNLLADVAGRGHQAILRFRYVYPGETTVSVPSYIETSAGFNSTIVQVEGQNTYLPDWSFYGLETFTLDFFTAFAARYDSDARIAFLQVGFGSYAEYHLYDGPVSLGNNFPSKTFQTTFLNKLHDEFTDLSWNFSIDAANSDYTPMATDASLVSLNFGVFDDSFMHETHSENDQEDNRSNWLFFGENKYQTNPAGGEFSYYTDYDQANVLNANVGAHGNSFEYFAELYHISYMLGNDQYPNQTADRIKEASMATGYKFTVEAFQSSSDTSKVTIKNIGIAPIYYDAYPAVNGIRATDSLKGLLPNTSIEFVISAGGTSPVLTIESDRLVNGQEIQFNANL